jgi:hypothetical protein
MGHGCMNFIHELISTKNNDKITKIIECTKKKDNGNSDIVGYY